MKKRLMFVRFLVFCFFQAGVLFAPTDKIYAYSWSGKTPSDLKKPEIDYEKLQEQMNDYLKRFSSDLEKKECFLFAYLVNEALNQSKGNIEIDFAMSPDFKKLLEPNENWKNYIYDCNNRFLNPCPFDKICSFYEYNYFSNKKLFPYIFLFLIENYPHLQLRCHAKNALQQVHLICEQIGDRLNFELVKNLADKLFLNIFELGLIDYKIDDKLILNTLKFDFSGYKYDTYFLYVFTDYINLTRFIESKESFFPLSLGEAIQDEDGLCIFDGPRIIAIMNKPETKDFFKVLCIHLGDIKFYSESLDNISDKIELLQNCLNYDDKFDPETMRFMIRCLEKREQN